MIAVTCGLKASNCFITYCMLVQQARIANHPYALIAFKDAATARKVVESTEAGEMNVGESDHRGCHYGR